MKAVHVFSGSVFEFKFPELTYNFSDLLALLHPVFSSIGLTLLTLFIPALVIYWVFHSTIF